MVLPLWCCPACGRTFANRNQSHFCGSITELEQHFARSDPKVRKLFDAFAAAVHDCGPVTVIPQKTRIAFQVRMSFAAITVRRESLSGHFVFAQRVENPRFARIETLSARNHVHHFQIRSAADIDAQFRRWIREAYAVGEQEHLSEVHAM